MDIDIGDWFSTAWDFTKELPSQVWETISGAFSEIEPVSLIIALIFWGLFSFLINFGTGMLGLEEFQLSYKITITVLLLPISYVIVRWRMQ